jgi:hypothetical protein
VIIDDIARDLYGLPPEAFTEARNARAKEVAASGDRARAMEVRRLSKPTTAAWLANMLVRTHPTKVEALISLGPELRQALGTSSRGDVRGVVDRRRAMIKELVDATSQFASDQGHAVGPQVRRQVEETLEAAVADEQSAAVLRAGCLSDPLVFIGFGAAAETTPHPSDSSPRARPTSASSRGTDPAERRRASEQAARGAAESLLSAQRAAESAQVLVRDARRRHHEASARHRQATTELRAAERDMGRAEQELAGALRRGTEAQQHLKEIGRKH